MEQDSIELMKCRNCKNVVKTESGLVCNQRRKQDGSYEDTKPDEHCSIFEEGDRKLELYGIYADIKDLLKEFIDTKEENYDIIALWIIGTYMHQNFPTYPYLFFNAMKGSGKTRLLKLIKELSWQGDMLASLSEAVLFRTTGTLCIDEFESIKGKDKNSLRELLNTAYKKGGKVKRMRKKKTLDGEQQVVEEFDTFRPIAMANIAGLEEVLSDRCITLILEKSNNPYITRKVENFDSNPKVRTITENLKKYIFSVVECSVDVARNIYTEWNNYIDITTLNYTTTLTTPNYTKLHQPLFDKIYATGIDGRNLELSFPLLLIANMVGKMEEVIMILKEIISSKKEEDVLESRDVMILNFISQQTPNERISIKELTTLFSQTILYDDEDRWLNDKWMGQALRRMNLILDKKRYSDGVHVILDVEKAKQKMEIFK